MGDEALCVNLLGAFSVTLDGKAVADDAWRLRKAKALVKLLALAPEQRLHSEEAAELLWPGRDPGSSRNNLHQAIFAARRALGSIGLDGRSCLELREDMLVLCPDRGLRLDTLSFEEAAVAARESGEAAAYRAALDVYGGDLLPEDRYEEWCAARREDLAELRAALAGELVELEAVAGRGRERRSMPMRG